MFLAGLLLNCSSIQSQSYGKLIYPATQKSDQKDIYFGNTVFDPYRWLENDHSEETEAWVKKENEVTYDYLSKIPYREKIRDRLTKIWSFEKVGTPFHKGKYYLYYYNSGTQNQSVLMIREGSQGVSRILLDPNTLSADGTVSLSVISLSKDGKYLAYATSKAGSDWETIQIMEIETGKVLGDRLEWVKFSEIAWKGDGFYYGRFDAPGAGKEMTAKNENQKIWYHHTGTDQSQDILFFEDKEHPKQGHFAEVSEDETHLYLYSSESTSGGSLRVKDLTRKDSPFITISETFESEYKVIDQIKSTLYIKTNRKAPKYRLITVDLNNPGEAAWKTLIPEKNDLLETVKVTENKLVVNYLKDVTNKLYLYSKEGKEERQIEPGGLGTIGNLNSDREDSLFFFSFTTYIAPPIVYQYNISTYALTVYSKPVIDFNSDELETKQVFYSSKDGTKIPMFITCKKGTKLDGNNPTFLFGYGGFNVSYTPEFRIDRAIFLENGGVYAVANLRGGGEYGEDWHKAGIKCKKQNVFDDFIAAAEYLINEKYTSHEKLAIHGRSNGGLLIGAVMTQKPDLAKVALPTVGVLDMLRYHLFTIGKAWAGDYGLSSNEEEFKCLFKYSPLHNVKEAPYPATLVLTGDHDDRVVPAHSFKFAATLQDKNRSDQPILIRIDINAGHAGGKPTSKQIDEFTDMWSFVFFNLGMKYGKS